MVSGQNRFRYQVSSISEWCGSPLSPSVAQPHFQWKVAWLSLYRLPILTDKVTKTNFVGQKPDFSWEFPTFTSTSSPVFSSSQQRQEEEGLEEVQEVFWTACQSRQSPLLSSSRLLSSPGLVTDIFSFLRYVHELYVFSSLTVEKDTYVFPWELKFFDFCRT